MGTFIQCKEEGVDLIDSGYSINKPINLSNITSMEKDTYWDMGYCSFLISFHGSKTESWFYSSEKMRDEQYEELLNLV
jgi:hypothetical protein